MAQSSVPCPRPSRRRGQPSAQVDADLATRMCALPDCPRADLEAEWRRLYRCEAPRISRDLLLRGLAYRHQELRRGGLGKTTRRKLKTLAKMFQTTGRVGADPGLALKPGARLVREWHGRTHTVTVTEDGFEYAGATYSSLTKVAKKITGARWSGPRFFGLVSVGTRSRTEPNNA